MRKSVNAFHIVAVEDLGQHRSGDIEAAEIHGHWQAGRQAGLKSRSGGIRTADVNDLRLRERNRLFERAPMNFRRRRPRPGLLDIVPQLDMHAPALHATNFHLDGIHERLRNAVCYIQHTRQPHRAGIPFPHDLKMIRRHQHRGRNPVLIANSILRGDDRHRPPRLFSRIAQGDVPIRQTGESGIRSAQFFEKRPAINNDIHVNVISHQQSGAIERLKQDIPRERITFFERQRSVSEVERRVLGEFPHHRIEKSGIENTVAIQMRDQRTA